MKAFNILLSISENRTITYLIIVFVIYFVSFLIKYLITKKIEKLRFNEKMNIIHKEKNNTERENATGNSIDEYLIKEEKKGYLYYRVSKLIILAFIVLVIISFISRGSVFENKYLSLLYYLLPLLSFNVISSGYEHYKENKKGKS